jgi:hypothetical protein
MNCSLSVLQSIADTLSSALTISALTAGEHYNLRIPIEAEAKVGQTWADVH